MRGSKLIAQFVKGRQMVKDKQFLKCNCKCGFIWTYNIINHMICLLMHPIFKVHIFWFHEARQTLKDTVEHYSRLLTNYYLHQNNLDMKYNSRNWCLITCTRGLLENIWKSIYHKGEKLYQRIHRNLHLEIKCVYPYYTYKIKFSKRTIRH